MPQRDFWGAPVVLSATRPKPAPVVVAKKPTTPGATAGAFDINPAPQAGQGAYGSVPGPVAYPPTPYEEATRLYPGLKNIEPGVFDEIQSQVYGDFTPLEENALWDISNRYGVQSGMPGAGLWSNRFMGNVVDARQKRKQQGISNYSALLEQYSKLGMDPKLAAELAARNATMGSAPNPEIATKVLADTFQNAQNNPGGGTLRNTTGQGNYDPAWAFRNSPASGTTSLGPTPKKWDPGYPMGPGPDTKLTSQEDFDQAAYDISGGWDPSQATTSSRTEEDLFNEWMDYIDPVSSGGYQQPYDPYAYNPAWNQDMDYITGMSDTYSDPGVLLPFGDRSVPPATSFTGGGPMNYPEFFPEDTWYDAGQNQMTQGIAGVNWFGATDPYASLDQTDGYENMDYLSDPWAFYE